MNRRATPLPALDAPGVPDRRAFLLRLWTGLGAVAAAEFLYAAASNVAPRAGEPSAGGGLVDVGSVEEFAPESVRAVPQWKLYVVRFKDGGFLALSSRCTHLGCSVDWDERRGTFPCPCHGSTFDLRGEVIGPPALRPLDAYPVVIERGVVKVDVAHPTRRAGFDRAQVALP